MNEDEKMIWTLAYMAAVIRGTDAATAALTAVIDFQTAENHFSEVYETPSEDYPDDDFPF